MMSRERRAIASYCEALENVRPDNLDVLIERCAAEIEFRDPFNHIFTRERFRDVLDHMFKSVRNLRFRVHRISGEGNIWVVKWTFTGQIRFAGAVEIEGLSEVELNDDLRVVRHIDYWDARTSILDKLPAIGMVLRLILKPTVA